jgi:uncharacterized protein (TIGR03435 family)
MRSPILLGSTLLVSATLAAQTPPVPAATPYTPTLTFDVASVRQSPEADSYMVSGSFSPNSSSLRITNFDAMNLLSMAYGIRWDQISGMPAWHAMFNIQAKSDPATDQRLATLTTAQQNLEHQHMLQALLADRFKLRIHWETRDGPTYNLVVAKSGPKLRPATSAPPTLEDLKFWGDHPIPPLYQRGDSRASFDFIAHAASMQDLVEVLSGQFGHPVTDKTGLDGKYDFILRYNQILSTDRGADDMNPIPPLETGIQDQLGLKLVPTRGPVQFLVIDHIEKPSEN